MRTIKVDPKKFELAVRQKAEGCKFVHIPSSNRKFVFAGLIMPAGVWVAWPQDLTEIEMSLYLDRYGNIPDLFAINKSAKELNFAPQGSNNGPDQEA